MKKVALFLARLGSYWQQPSRRNLSWGSFLLILAQIFLLIVFGGLLLPQVPVFYSRPWGRAQLASPDTLFLFPALGLAVLLTNSILAVFFLKEEVLTLALAWASFLFNSLELLALLHLFARFLF